MFVDKIMYMYMCTCTQNCTMQFSFIFVAGYLIIIIIVVVYPHDVAFIFFFLFFMFMIFECYGNIEDIVAIFSNEIRHHLFNQLQSSRFIMSRHAKKEVFSFVLAINYFVAAYLIIIVGC